MRVLTVTNPFGGHSAGDTITDPAEVREVLSGENSPNVVQTERADKPAKPKE